MSNAFDMLLVFVRGISSMLLWQVSTTFLFYVALSSSQSALIGNTTMAAGCRNISEISELNNYFDMRRVEFVELHKLLCFNFEMSEICFRPDHFMNS